MLAVNWTIVYRAIIHSVDTSESIVEALNQTEGYHIRVHHDLQCCKLPFSGYLLFRLAQ